MPVAPVLEYPTVRCYVPSTGSPGVAAVLEGDCLSRKEFIAAVAAINSGLATRYVIPGIPTGGGSGLTLTVVCPRRKQPLAHYPCLRAWMIRLLRPETKTPMRLDLVPARV
jgi:hypothetical protein